MIWMDTEAINCPETWISNFDVVGVGNSDTEVAQRCEWQVVKSKFVLHSLQKYQVLGLSILRSSILEK
jgi:hypothetical protein